MSCVKDWCTVYTVTATVTNVVCKRLGPYSDHCRNYYFQTKIELRQRSAYVRMQNDVLTLVGALLPN